jgi:hypothetical protein
MVKVPSMHIKLTEPQRNRLKILAENAGFNTVSSYVRFLAFNPSFEMKLNKILDSLEDLKKIVQE